VSPYPEKGQNGNIEMFFTKIVGNHGKFYFSLLETSGKHSFNFLLLPALRAMNHSGTPLT